MPVVRPSSSATDLNTRGWPTFTDAQVSFLEKLYPARVMGMYESLEAHVRYAGKVDLIEELRANVPSFASTRGQLNMTPEEEEAALDNMAAGMVLSDLKE